MPVSTSPSSLPASSSTTYTSVFGGQESENALIKGSSTLSSARPLPSRAQHSSTLRSAHSSNPSSGSRRGSLRSNSADSSPTTTISTVDSSLTEPSPSSSPESPTGLAPLVSFPNLNSTTKSLSERRSMDRASQGLSSPPSFEPSTSPNRKGKNLRNLSINTVGISTTRPATAPSMNHATENSTASLPAVPQANLASGSLERSIPGTGEPADATVTNHAFSEPASPSFIVPNVPRPRKSKLGLTITTSDSSGSSSGGIPATPAFAPPPKTMAFNNGFSKLGSVRKDEDTLFSPSAAPAGGMKLPPFGFGRSFDLSMPTPSQGPEGGMSLPPLGGYDAVSQRPTSRPALSIGQKSFEGGPGSSVINQTIEHSSQVPLHDLPLSREVKSPSYPAGPACIYPPNVFLYHQPTCEEAREFDLIINVAREVSNPFKAEQEEAEARKAEKGYTDSSVQCDLLPAPPLSLAFVDAPEVPIRKECSHDDEPDTPKASSPRPSKKDPEYVHLPWEHNSTVYSDWLGICEKIDKAALSGKKVLIHCQLGVSRSASLIVAYGLYKNPSLSPDEAREQAKAKSKWIDLNMHFMYELGDFKKLLVEKFGEHHATRRAAGPTTLARSKTDFMLSGSQATEDIPRRASDGKGSTFPEKIEEEPTATMSAFPGTSTLPFGRDAAPLPPMPSRPMELSLRPPPAPIAETETESSGGTTPKRTDPTPERGFPQRTKTNDSDRTVKADTTPESSSPPPLPIHSILSDQQATNKSDPPSPSHETPAKPIPSIAAIANDSPHIPDPTPPRRLRPMPSLPAGFNSIRRVSPVLSLNTNTQPSGLDSFQSLNAPAPFSSVAPTQQPPQQSKKDGAPALPDLDFGGASLMSPRTTEFVMNPFHRKRSSMAGDLAGRDFPMSPTVPEDPRSPPIKNEIGVTRSIDDVL